MSETTDSKTAATSSTASNGADTGTVAPAKKPGRGVQLTERAAKEIQRVIGEQNFPLDSTWVRIGAKGGGCSGFTYVLDFDQNKIVNDMGYQICKFQLNPISEM